MGGLPYDFPTNADKLRLFQISMFGKSRKVDLSVSAMLRQRTTVCNDKLRCSIRNRHQSQV